MGPWMHGGGWGWAVGWHLLFWAVAVVLTLVLVAALTRRPADRTTTVADPRQILAERFARGEIDAEEFEHRRRVLG